MSAGVDERRGMTKDEILDTIRALTAAHGKPPGAKMMHSEADIKPSDWAGRYWARWSDALREAGFAPNSWKYRYDETYMLERFARLIRDMGRVPTMPEYELKRRTDRSLPSGKTYGVHFGSKEALLVKVREYCKTRRALRRVVTLCGPPTAAPPSPAPSESPDRDGYVYLLRSGRNYKIGRTKNLERRTGELAVQLPDKALRVHVIKTDDPKGVENYWHRRFAARRKNGEFFGLRAEDVRAFKRWRRI
jgi:hypothetical protein